MLRYSYTLMTVQFISANKGLLKDIDASTKLQALENILAKEKKVPIFKLTIHKLDGTSTL